MIHLLYNQQPIKKSTLLVEVTNGQLLNLGNWVPVAKHLKRLKLLELFMKTLYSSLKSSPKRCIPNYES